MNGPAIRAVMERRLLVNYRVDPDLLASFLPAPFRPALVSGYGIAGVGSASRFFECAPLGYAATPTQGLFDGIKLETEGWQLSPLRLDEVHLSFFDDPGRFPAGAAVPDSAFLMGGLATTWHPQPALRVTARGPRP